MVAQSGMEVNSSTKRPIVNDPPMRTKAVPSSALAVTDARDLANKLTLSSDQMTSTDANMVGLSGDDPMSITSIANRESYMGSFVWGTASTPNTTLVAIPVQPVAWMEGPSVSYHFTATAAASLPFQYWGGTLRYRFQIVCSAYHRGRVRIVWDPNYMSTSALAGEYNINHIKVIDIADTQDFTIDVGWGQPTPLTSRFRPGIELIANVITVTPPIVNQRGNGVLYMQVLNKLTTPNSVANNDIQVNVYVSAADDFKVAVPANDILSFGFTAQSGIEDNSIPEETKTVELDKPQQDVGVHLGAVKVVPDAVFNNFFGENITSMRALINRFSIWRYEDWSQGNSMNKVRFPMYPFYRGVGGPDQSTISPLPAGYAFVNSTYLQFITMCYAAWRGSIRYKIAMKIAGSNGQGTTNHVECQRVKPRTTYGYLKSTAVALSATTFPRSGVSTELTDQGNTAEELSCLGGGAISAGFQMLEVEVPFYSLYKFSTGRWVVHTSAPPPCPDIEHLAISGYTQSSAILGIYVAAGDDYQCYWWLGLPRMYRNSIVPV